MGYSINPKGRNWGSLVNWDDLGKFYASFAIAWTVILYTGIGWLVLHRRLSFLKIRNIPLAIASTSFLHVYLIKILLAYTTNGHFLCSAEFWIMSIYLPFGMALFQANMIQLQSISGQQKKLLEGHRPSFQASIVKRQRGIRGLWVRWCAMTELQKTYVFIGIGMLVQVIVTAAIYATSPMLQGHWRSIWGNKISHAEGQAKCRKGWEWIPSAIWQLVWSWFYGPFILYKIRNIKDVHYWRLQTILCVVSGLPGSPLWLAALYSTEFRQVNRYWVPPMWLAPGIIVIQAVTVFFPIFEAYKSRSQMKNTLDILKTWEEKKLTDNSTQGSSGSSKHDSFFSAKKPASTATNMSRSSREIYTIAALEKALAMNPVPLLQFAATKDFTGENIVFLMQVREWRAAWTRAPRYLFTLTEKARGQLFNKAIEIYASSIHDKTAEFPINIESRIRRDLDTIFGPAMADMKYNLIENVVDPFNAPRDVLDGPRHQSIELSPPKIFSRVLDRQDSSESGPTLWESQESILPGGKGLSFEAHPCVQPLVYEPSVPAGFDEHIFDAAEKSIKYLVVTNTWQKFVDSSKGHNAVSP